MRISHLKTNRQGKDLSVEITATKGRDGIDVTISVEIESNRSDLKIEASTANRQISLVDIDLDNVTPFVACVAACVAPKMIGPLIQCFSRDKDKYLECLSLKGLEISAGVVECLLSC